MKNRKQFTLVEILIVIGIVVVLAGMLLGGLNMATGKAENAKAKSEIMNLRNAIAAFEQEYNKLPKPTGGSKNTFKGKNADDDPIWIGPKDEDQSSSDQKVQKDAYKWLIYVLQGKRKSDFSNDDKDLFDDFGDPNTRKKVFLPMQGNDYGEYKDPWDNDFYIVFEWKYDKGINNKNGVIPGLKASEDSGHDRWIRYNMVIWSDGSDGKYTKGKDNADWKASNNEDNIYSLETQWSDGHTITR